jgi:hypothetical protein
VGYGDIYPTHPLSKFITVVMELTVIPLFAAAYSLMTVGLTSTTVTKRVNKHIDARHEQVMQTVNDQIGELRNDSIGILGSSDGGVTEPSTDNAGD